MFNNKKILIIIVIGLIFALAETTILYFQNKKISINTQSQYQNKGTNAESELNEKNLNKLTDYQALKYFKATEIDYNNWPINISFWIEGACPNSKTQFDYSFPEGYTYVCEGGNIGTHNVCSKCDTSKITLELLNIPFDKQGSFVCEDRLNCKINVLDSNEIEIIKNKLSPDILNSDALLKNLIEETGGIVFNQILIKRGNFDESNNNQVVIVSLCIDNCEINFEDGLNGLESVGFDDFLIITQEDKTFKIDYIITHSITRDISKFSIQPLELIYNNKPFFIGKLWSCGSTTTNGCDTDFYLFKIKSGKLIPFSKLISSHDGGIYHQNTDNYTYRIDNIKKIIFQDLDNDNNKEIIVTKSLGEGESFDDIKDFKEYQIEFAWNKTAKYFLPK